MNKFKSYSSALPWVMALVLSAVAAGCGGGGGGRDPILGAGGVTLNIVLPAGSVLPGACSALTGPKVTLSNPTHGSLSTTTSTAGVAGNGKLITATFSEAMDPLTINSATAPLTFTVKDMTTTAGVNVTGVVTMNAANTVATFTTSAALLPGTAYAATITQAAQSATHVPAGCLTAWGFKTATLAAAGLAPINLGLAAPFAIAATAGVTNTGVLPNTTINGNVVLDPVTGAICNTVPVDAAGSFGLCGGFAPVLHGQVISPLYPDAGATSGAIKADLQAAYLSITPPGGPPAAGSLGGATSIPAGTTLGAPTGNALVQGDNYFVPGVYRSTTSILVTGDLTLDAQGNPDAVFVFQSSSTVGSPGGAPSPGAHTRILLIGGAKASNVWWQAGSSATLGSYDQWQGNILAGADVTMVTGATSCGRLFAGGFTDGAFVLSANVISVPGHANAPAGCQ